MKSRGSGSSTGDTKALELSMSGLSFVSGLPSSNSRPPALSGSSISSAPDEHHHRHHSFGSVASFPNSNEQVHLSSHPPSPSSPSMRGTSGVIGTTTNHNIIMAAQQGYLPKPPGLSDSPFSAFGQQGLPFETNWNPSYNNKDADSFDRSEDDDGLMGLGALRERALSSPGPIHSFSSSPPVRIDVNPYQGDLSPLPTDGSRYLPPDPRRRPSSYKGGGGNARPPLSGQSSSQQAAFVDSSFNSSGNTFGGRSSPGSHDVSYEYSPSGGRSDMAERLQGGRSRSLTVGSEPQQHDYRANEQFRQHPMDHTQKFGSLPSLSQQQRFPHQMQQQQPNRHNRSYSHSGPLQQYGLQESHPDDGSRRGYDHHQQQQQGRMQQHQRLHSDGSDGLFGGNDSLYIRGHQSASNLPRSLSDHHSAPGMQRSVSMSQTPFQFDNQPQRRNSDVFAGQQYAGQQRQYPNLQRRDEFSGQESAAPIMATAEELRAYGIQDERGTRQQQQQRYPSPNHAPRRHADFVPMSSSGGQMRGGGRYVVQGHDHRQYGNSGQDDDLTHPLAGELIDDPGDDLGLSNQSSMMQNMHHASHIQYRSNNDMMQGGHHMGRSPTGMSPHYMTMDGVHLGASLPAPRLVYNVKFKRTQRNFIIGPRVARDLKIGCYVKVEADRGEDLGIVVSKVAAEKFNSAGRSSFRTAGSPGGVGDIGMMGGPGMPQSTISDLKRIIRLATHDEVALLTIKREEEEELLKICRTKVRQRALPMHVVDAEYQFDRHKLTFFFEAEGRIDFRELVRDLFSMYKTRIWMQQLDKNVPTILAPAPDYGTSPLNQVPVMADSIHEPYGISSDLGAGGNHST